MTLTVKKGICYCIFLMLFVACTKNAEQKNTITPSLDNVVATVPTNPTFIDYLIKKGSQFCLQNIYKEINTQEMKFVVKFDSSAVYETINPANQFDINKLYGFADNDSIHHVCSARFGWNWINNSLWLYGYVYNNTVLLKQTLTTIPIGQEINCSIKVNGNTYIFMVNGTAFTMPRTSTTPKGKGYQLYPYFGGDELAPHDIRIAIKEL
ncbi:MAG: hypothetical protein H7178_07905 [Chitinophagaceae bacterium]|nr:hypothetical protein [Chitinophagaceae bacterium]